MDRDALIRGLTAGSLALALLGALVAAIGTAIKVEWVIAVGATAAIAGFAVIVVLLVGLLVAFATGRL